jgi:hypothetical protein
MYLMVVLLDGEAAAEMSAGEDPDPFSMILTLHIIYCGFNFIVFQNWQLKGVKC